MEDFLVALAATLLLWAGFSFTCVIRPMRPMRTRAQALLSVLGTLAVVAILASYIPARRVSRIHPAEALQAG